MSANIKSETLVSIIVESNAADQVFIYGISFEFSDNTILKKG
jgi:hypothetical protein